MTTTLEPNGVVSPSGVEGPTIKIIPSSIGLMYRAPSPPMITIILVAAIVLDYAIFRSTRIIYRIL